MRRIPGRLWLVVTLLTACNDGTGPADSADVIELFPTVIGTTWTYVTRDTLIAGTPDSRPWPIRRITTLVTGDTTAYGRKWYVGDFADLMPEHWTGGDHSIYYRNAPDGLHFLSLNPLMPVEIRDQIELPPPTRVGLRADDWTVAALNERIETPAGVFFAARYEHATSYYDSTIFGPKPQRWVVPGVGIVRSMWTTMSAYDGQGNFIRTRRIIEELESFTRPQIARFAKVAGSMNPAVRTHGK